MSYSSSFMRAACMELPTHIGGVRIPVVDAAELNKQARGIAESLDGLEGYIERAVVVRPVIDSGVRFVSECCDAIHVADQILTSTRVKMVPLEGVLCRSAEVACELSGQETDQCADVFGDIMHFGRLIENLSLLLSGAREVFRQILKVAMPAFEAGCIEASYTTHFSVFRQQLDDMMSTFEEAAFFHSAWQGLVDLVQNTHSLVDELHGMRDEFGSAADQRLGAEEMHRLLYRLMRAWDRCQEQYNAAVSVGGSTLFEATRTQDTYREVLSALSISLGSGVVD